MESVDAAGSNMEAGLLVAATYATQEGCLPQDSPSRNAPIQTTGEAQVADCARPLATLTEHRG